MNECWHQLGRFLWWGGTSQGAVVLIGLGAVGGLVTGAILLVIEGVRAFIGGVREGHAGTHVRRFAKGEIRSDDSRAASPANDVPPSSDL